MLFCSGCVCIASSAANWMAEADSSKVSDGTVGVNGGSGDVTDGFVVVVLFVGVLNVFVSRDVSFKLLMEKRDMILTPSKL